MVTKYFAAAAATALVAAPAMAAPANPASSLSLGKSVRANAPTSKRSKLSQGGLIVAVLSAGVVAGGIIAVAKDDNSDSN